MDSQADINEYIVEGMTCGRCAHSVHEEVTAVAGVRAVDVDLPSRRLTVTGAGVDPAVVRDAVAGAGYALAA
jgi:copper chaperone